MIREAIKEDLNDISKILREVHNLHMENRPEIFKELKEPINMDYYESMLEKDSNKIFIKITNGKILGYTTFIIHEVKNHPVYQDMKILKMEDFAVLKEFQKEGIGSELFDYTVNYAKKIQADKIELQVWNFNEKAKKFYMKKSMNIKSLNLEISL